jgi:hypothetical protein
LASQRPISWPRMAMHAAWIAVVAALGFALSTSLQQAKALGLPTVTLPGVATVAVTVPSISTVAATTTVATAPPSSQSTSPAVPAPATQPTATTPAIAATPDDDPLAGMVRLSGGVVSIPVSSVRLPARLRILLSFAPKTIVHGSQPISVQARIVDTRGYVVRGARVLVKAGRTGTLRGAGNRLSAVDGLVAFVVHNRVALGRAKSLVLLVQAFDPTAPKATTTSRRLQIAVRSR